LKAKVLAFILALMLCPCLLCDSSSELQKAQDLLAKRSLAEAVTALRQVVQNDRSNLDAHLSLATEISYCRGFELINAFTFRKTTAP
jgi:Tfp pilus assembly protein PilF